MSEECWADEDVVERSEVRFAMRGHVWEVLQFLKNVQFTIVNWKKLGLEEVLVKSELPRLDLLCERCIIYKLACISPYTLALHFLHC